jgi:type I restriction-modification system DNA methylase subunit
MTTAPKIIIDLVRQFEEEIILGSRKKTEGEEQIRANYINPMFEVLGWATVKKTGKSFTEEVTHEFAVEIEGKTKKPDYSFNLGHKPQFFVEVKRPSVNIKESGGSAYQARRYGFNAGIPVILTDFEEFAVYEVHEPKLKDRASVARVYYYTYKDFLDKWGEICNLFSREAVLEGSLKKFISERNRKGKEGIDSKFLKDIEFWRNSLAENIAKRNQKITQRELNTVVQKTLDRILFLRICEERDIEIYGGLKEIKGKEIYKKLCNIFLDAEIKYNSGLFYFNDKKGKSDSFPEGSQLKLKIDDAPLNEILEKLYPPESPYEFSVLPVEILGQVYEQFLGKVIILDENHKTKVIEKPEVKKAGGVYYTPSYIVNYIVGNTVGELLKKAKTIEKASKLTVLDPSCGSGSFLLGAYQYLLDWYLEKYLEKKKKKSDILYETKSGWKLTIAEKKKILLDNIYGVDIDPQAVELTKLSLLLKTLEGETKETVSRQMSIFKEKALPNLSKNIKCGNALIGMDFYENQQMQMFSDEEQFKINAFDWEVRFKEIMGNGGFDAVIGNPPYVGEKGNSYLFDNLKKIKKWNSYYRRRTNLYYFFIKKGIDLLKNQCPISFIVPREFITADWANKVRKEILTKSRVSGFVDFNDLRVFQDAGTSSFIFTIFKTNESTPNYKFKLRSLKNQASIESDLFNSLNCLDRDIDELDSSGVGLWNFYQNNKITAGDNISTLGGLFDVSQGLVTGADKVTKKHCISGLIGEEYIGRGIFILKENIDIKFSKNSCQLNINNEWKTIDKENWFFIKPFIKTDSLQKWSIKEIGQWVIVAGERDLVGYVKKYLEQFSGVLLNRSTITEEDEKITLKEFNDFSLVDIKEKYSSAGAVQKIMRRGKWYSPLYERADIPFEGPKIIVNTKIMNNFTYSENEHYASGGGAGGQNYIYPSLRKNPEFYSYLSKKNELCGFVKYVNALLNSSLIKKYIKDSQYNQLSTSKISELPLAVPVFKEVKKLNTYNSIIEKSDQLINLYKKIGKTSHEKEIIKSLIEATEGQIDELVEGLYEEPKPEVKIP